MVPCGNGQERIEPLLEGGRILPKEVVQENSHRIHAQAFCPAKLLVNFPRIESIRLPHFELVAGAGRQVIAAHQPRLLGVPLVGL